MGAITRWFRRIWHLLNRRAIETVLQQEMEAHREQLGDRRAFGNFLQLREEARDVWGWSWLDAIVRDVRLAARSLRRTRGFTITVITSLAIGLTFVASIVAIVNAYLIQPFPYSAADRLYHVMYAPPGPFEPAGVSTIDWTSLRDVVEFPITASGETFYIGDAGYSAPARGLRAGRHFLDGLGVRAAIGRSFAPGDFEAGGDQVALIGDALWRGRFGADPAIVGRVIHSDVENQDDASPTYRVIGVLPPGFWYGRESSTAIDVMVPLRTPVQTYLVRLRPGIRRALAEQRITEATRSVSTNIPLDWTGVHLESMRERYVAMLRPVLIAITVAAGLVLVIVCANIAVLTLLRAMRRQKEMSVRVALGAGRGHIVRMLAAETVLLSLTAVAITIVLTTVTLRVLGPIVETHLGRPAPRGAASITLDPTVLLTVGGVGLLTALSLAFLPLLTPWQRRLAGALHGAGRSATDSPTMHRARLALIGFEISGSLVLLVGCATMIRNVASMVNSDLGFRTDHLVRVGMVVPARAYPDSTAMVRFYQRLSERVGALVQSPVAFTGWPPYYDFPDRPFAVEGGAASGLHAGAVQVGSNYFAMLGIPIRQGREFAPSDLPGAEPVAVISEALARQLWPGEGAVGRRIRTLAPGTATMATPWRTVVGVVANVRQTYGDHELRDIYVPYYQATPGRYGSFYVRSDVPTPMLLERFRVGIGETDPLAIVRWVNTMASEDRQLAGATFVTTLLTTVAAFAVLLALLGIYGVMSYAVRQREREIAIRIAIGATGGMVIALFLRHGSLVLGVGTVGGLVASVAMERIIASRLTGFGQLDPWTLAGAAAFMVITGLVAVWWPARRAARTSPVVILNAD